MHKFLAGIASVALMTVPALAADIPVKAAPPIVETYSWAGSYWGINGGVLKHKVDRLFPDRGGGIGAVHLFTDGDIPIIGIHSGAQWQVGRVVFGFETAFSFCPGGSQSSCNTDTVVTQPGAAIPGFVGNLTVRHRLSSLSTVGGRLGYGFDRVLIFGQGGYAGGNMRAEWANTTTGISSFPSEQGSVWLNGWYAGGGFDFLLWGNNQTSILLGADYQYYRLERKSVSIFATSSDLQFSVDDRGHVIRGRLTFKVPNIWGAWLSPAPN
jgi:outer membrane immunogenic protein